MAAEALKRSEAAEQSAADNIRTLAALATTPLFDVVPQESAKPIEFLGYARSGFGVNEPGGQHVEFQAPGATAKFRLGNEADTCAGLVFVSNWFNPVRDPNKAWFKTELLVTATADNLSSFDASSNLRFREAFAQAGNRYYGRRQIHVNSFFSTDFSGYGGGVEDVDVGLGTAALAYIGSANPATPQ